MGHIRFWPHPAHSPPHSTPSSRSPPGPSLAPTLQVCDFVTSCDLREVWLTPLQSMLMACAQGLAFHISLQNTYLCPINQRYRGTQRGSFPGTSLKQNPGDQHVTVSRNSCPLSHWSSCHASGSFHLGRLATPPQSLTPCLYPWVEPASLILTWALKNGSLGTMVGCGTW